MSQPLVTVICLCHNHERFVREAVESVYRQSYSRVQLIIVDDCSQDQSVALIKELIRDRPEIVFIVNDKNIGNCKSFNLALTVAQGEFIIDLAADDILLPERIATGVGTLQKAGIEYGVQFSDAEIVSEKGGRLYLHSDKYPHHTIPQGDIYRELIDRFFICSPTMMFRMEVMEHMNGYDESLAFEDFDFWIRSSRKFKYCYVPQVLEKKRLVNSSMSQRQFTRGNHQRWSTLAVCKKIKALNRNLEEDKALQRRLRYEFLLSMRMMDVSLAMQFLKLWVRK
ncbi:MAG: glycosyltransferase family 2 protein [Bacteroidia bacterium]|nr:glycosyltransferase family 2 protein [Bacteroidia bacterium]